MTHRIEDHPSFPYDYGQGKSREREAADSTRMLGLLFVTLLTIAVGGVLLYLAWPALQALWS